MKRFLMTLMIVMTTVSVAQKQEQPFFIPTLGMTAKELHSRILIEKDCPALMAQWDHCVALPSGAQAGVGAVY
jgi:hypothetical protein